MDSLHLTDYNTICRLCLSKGHTGNQICSTNRDIIQIVYDCTTILLNTDEPLPQNVCAKCTNQLNEFKSFREYCLKNDELIRLHSLLHHCTDVGNQRDELQDIADYVKEELQEELNSKGIDLGFNEVDSIFKNVEAVLDKELPFVCDGGGGGDSGESRIDHQIEINDNSNASKIIGDKLKLNIIAVEQNILDDSVEAPQCCGESITTDGKVEEVVDEKDDDEEESEMIEIQIETPEEEFIRIHSKSGRILLQEEEHDKKQQILHSQLHEMCGTDRVLITLPTTEIIKIPKIKKSSQNHPTAINGTTISAEQKYCLVSSKLCSNSAADAHNSPQAPEYDPTTIDPNDDGYPYKCEHCEKIFSTSWKRSRHIKMVHVDALLECNKCSVKFKSKMNLVRHQKTLHDKNNLCECNVCNKTFSCRDSLKRHMLLHNGAERTYLCEICDKTFLNYFNLKTHSRRHTQEKPYKCHLCGCAFGYSGVYKNHMLKVHKNVP